jgi:hypothetical protein
VMGNGAPILAVAQPLVETALRLPLKLSQGHGLRLTELVDDVG